MAFPQQQEQGQEQPANFAPGSSRPAPQQAQQQGGDDIEVLISKLLASPQAFQRLMQVIMSNPQLMQIMQQMMAQARGGQQGGGQPQQGMMGGGQGMMGR